MEVDSLVGAAVSVVDAVSVPGAVAVGALASPPPHAASTSTSETHRHDIPDTVGVSVTPVPTPDDST